VSAVYLLQSAACDDVVFGGGLWPLGWSIGFVERPLGETSRRYRAWGLNAHFEELG
jgi:hypothetical protein